MNSASSRAYGEEKAHEGNGLGWLESKVIVPFDCWGFWSVMMRVYMSKIAYKAFFGNRFGGVAWLVRLE